MSERRPPSDHGLGDKTLVRITSRRLLLVAATVVLAFSGWFLMEDGEAASAQERVSARPGVVAEVGGKAITRDELRPAIAAGLAELERRQAELWSSALERRIDDLLIEAEAAKRGVSPEALLASVMPAEGDARATLLRELRRRADVRIFGDTLPAALVAAR